MQIIEQPKHFSTLKNGNKFIGELPKMTDSRVCFRGKNNVLFCAPNVHLKDTNIEFQGDNSVVFLSSNKFSYKVFVYINHNSSLYIGENCYFNGVFRIFLSEEGNCIIGDDCLFSFGIWARTADPHLIYDAKTKQRVNPTKSIFIGDHVWLGQGSMILKGTQIGSGAIIGAMSLVSNKQISSNECWAGNPARMLKQDIFWDGDCVHQWTSQNTKESQNYHSYIAGRKNTDPERFIFAPSQKELLAYGKLEKDLKKEPSALKRQEYLAKTLKSPAKNRFAR